MISDPRLPSDRDLMAAARVGDDLAWTELASRHREGVRRFARGADIEDRDVDAAFAAVRAGLATADDVDSSLPKLRAVRLLLLHAVAAVDAGPAASGDATSTTIATAFGQLPEDWQAVLWHRCVDRAPAVEATVMLGRSTTEVLALEQTAIRGLFDRAMLVEVHGDPPLPWLCRPVVAALGAYRRGSLPPAEERAVDEHLNGAGASAGCAECRARLDIAARLPELVAPAVVPWVTGRAPADYRAAAGIVAAAGIAALVDRRTAADRRRARVLATAAVLLALIAAAVLIRSPFRSFEPELADLLNRATTTTVPDAGTPTSTIPPGPIDGDPNRVELVFPETPRGAVYVPGGRPLDLSLALSSPAPVFAGGTGTVDVELMNNDTVAVDVTFYVRTTVGIAFDEQTEGAGTCRAEDDDGATCAVSIGAGAKVSKSLRFTVERHVPDRFVVHADEASLDLPVEFLGDLVLGTVERGHLTTFTGVLAQCGSPPWCVEPAEWVDGAAMGDAEAAYLVWRGVSATDAPPRVELAVGDEVTLVEPTSWTAVDGATYRIADVTVPVASAVAGSGAVAVASSDGGGTWTLIVVTRDASATRRLMVVTAPDAVVSATAAFATTIPVAGSQPPITPRRPGRVETVALVAEPGAAALAVDDVPVGGDDPFGLAATGRAPAVRSYDLDIDSSSAAIQIAASTTTAEFRLAGLALVLDIVP